MISGGATDNASTRSRSNALGSAARAISWIGHPLVFVSVSLAIIVVSRLANRVGILVLAALIFAVVLPTALLLIRGVRSGRWSDADVSMPTERASFYPPAILLSLGGVIALVIIGAPGFIFRGAVITLVLLLLAAGINRFVKISLHTIFAFYCAVILLRIGFLPGAVAVLLALLVAWSRLHLRRHTVLEVFLGAFLGTCGGVVTAWLP
jgi:hypothetical protein